MTDQPETPRLSAEDEERVRRELAAAPGPGSIPDDVAGRLDDVLAGLVRERSVEAVPPGPEPSRRRWPTLLVAAAAVAVLVLGVGTLVTSVTGPRSAEQGAGSQAASAPQHEGQPSAPDAAGAFGAFSRAAPVARLRSDTFQRDVQRLTDRLSAATPLDAPKADGSSRRAPRSECRRPPRPPGGRVLRVTLDGRAASLVLGPARDGTRVARAYSCADTDAPELSTRVRAR